MESSENGGGVPAPPTVPVLDSDDPRTPLRERLLTVLLGLPAYFEFNNHVAGVEATDLHALNTLLGASIEGQVVKALNQQRKLWDPDDYWRGYVFERQSQRFPDVLLTRKGGEGGPDIALGIELKGLGQRIQQKANLFHRRCHQNHTFFHRPALELKNARYRLKIPGIAAQAPHSLGRVGDNAALQDLSLIHI